MIVFSIFFGEKLPKIMLLGILIVISGVIMITATKTHRDLSDTPSLVSDESVRLSYKFLAIGLSTFAACLGALRIV